MAGMGEGLRTANPYAGMAMTRGLNQRPFLQAHSDWQAELNKRARLADIEIAQLQQEQQAAQSAALTGLYGARTGAQQYLSQAERARADLQEAQARILPPDYPTALAGEIEKNRARVRPLAPEKPIVRVGPRSGAAVSFPPGGGEPSIWQYGEPGESAEEKRANQAKWQRALADYRENLIRSRPPKETAQKPATISQQRMARQEALKAIYAQFPQFKNDIDTTHWVIKNPNPRLNQMMEQMVKEALEGTQAKPYSFIDTGPKKEGTAKTTTGKPRYTFKFKSKPTSEEAPPEDEDDEDNQP